MVSDGERMAKIETKLDMHVEQDKINNKSILDAVEKLSSKFDNLDNIFTKKDDFSKLETQVSNNTKSNIKQNIQIAKISVIFGLITTAAVVLGPKIVEAVWG